MYRLTATMATTHVDSHGEALAREALVGMADHIAACYVPFGVGHDPRIPPIGRIVSARVETDADGESALVGEIEIFEDGDASTRSGDRVTLLRFQESTQLAVVDDRAFRGPEDQSLIGNIRTGLQATAYTERKKAAEPIAVLTIAGCSFAAGAFATGFFGEMGKDAWGVAKKQLGELFGRQRDVPAQLLNLEHTIDFEGRKRRLDIILGNPSDADIAAIVPERFVALESLTRKALAHDPELVRIVFSFNAENGLVLQYGVTEAGFPVLFACPRPQLPDQGGFSFGG